MRTVILNHECKLCHYKTKEVTDLLDGDASKRCSFKRELDGKKPFYRIYGVGCIRCPNCGIVSTFEEAETIEPYE
jgi:hypothetical protein